MESYEEEGYWDDIPEDWQDGITKEYTWPEIGMIFLNALWFIPYLFIFLAWDSIKRRCEKLRSML